MLELLAEHCIAVPTCSVNALPARRGAPWLAALVHHMKKIRELEDDFDDDDDEPMRGFQVVQCGNVSMLLVFLARACARRVSCLISADVSLSRKRLAKRRVSSFGGVERHGRSEHVYIYVVLNDVYVVGAVWWENWVCCGIDRNDHNISVDHRGKLVYAR